MSLPVYVTSENILFNSVLSDTIVLETVGPDRYVLLYDDMDVGCKAEFDAIYVANGNVIPDRAILDTTPISLLINGRTFYYTYKSLIKKVGVKPELPTAPFDKNLVYFDGAVWKYLYNDTNA